MPAGFWPHAEQMMVHFDAIVQNIGPDLPDSSFPDTHYVFELYASTSNTWQVGKQVLMLQEAGLKMIDRMMSSGLKTGQSHWLSGIKVPS